MKWKKEGVEGGQRKSEEILQEAQYVSVKLEGSYNASYNLANGVWTRGNVRMWMMLNGMSASPNEKWSECVCGKW